jgi:hypothetical protein
MLAEFRRTGVVLLAVAGLAVGVSCVFAPSAASKDKAPLKPADDGNVITVFLTGNELGALKPCGCSGGQLGGLDRRAVVIKSVPKRRRLVVDTGSLVKDDSEQDLIKFSAIVQAFKLLGYDVVNLAEQDFEIGKNFGLLDSIGPGLSLISAYRVREGTQDAGVKTQGSGKRVGDSVVQATHTKRFLLEDGAVDVTVAAFDAKAGPVERVQGLFAREPDVRAVNILILSECDEEILGAVAKEGIVDCVVCPAVSDEPKVVGEVGKAPLVISVGRYGEYVGRVCIRAVEGGLRLNFSAVPVTEDLLPEAALVRLYEDYQRLVKEAGLLERVPRFSLRNGLGYVGSASCKMCHEYEYEKWGEKAHARAFATLERVGSDYDPECVVCHVVGMKYESGFVSAERTGHLKDVGCENCHGPGSEHVSSLGKVETTEPRQDCTDCHTPEQSSEYAGNEEVYFEKIVHWREPNAGGNVEK